MPPKQFSPRLRRAQPSESAAPDISALFDVAPSSPVRDKTIADKEPSDAPREDGKTPPRRPRSSQAATEDSLAPISKGAAEPAEGVAPSTVEPLAEEPPEPGRDSLQGTSMREMPAQPGATAAETVPIFTYLGAEDEERLHRAAYARSGESAKSEIVREALSAVQNVLRNALPAERDASLDEIRLSGVGDRSRSSRIYRITAEQKLWLHELAGADRVPMAATVRWAIGRHLDTLEMG